jgi:CubicO group peptidase (beta-lactamase class C family)
VASAVAAGLVVAGLVPAIGLATTPSATTHKKLHRELDRAVKLACRFAPDAGWEYCDTCYVLLCQIIERATGHLLADELRQRVFVPAGLRATSFDTEPRIAGRHAHGHERLGKKLRLTDVAAISPPTSGPPARSCRPLMMSRASTAGSTADSSCVPTC